MKRFLLIAFVILFVNDLFAGVDTLVIPIGRIRFHERVDAEQKALDKADGKQDGIVKASPNDEINLQVTDVVLRKIDDLQQKVEANEKIVGNNEKIRNLNYIETLLREARNGWKQRTFNPVEFPLLVEQFEKANKAVIDSVSIAPLIYESPYEIADILVKVFDKCQGCAEGRNIVFLKFAQLYPDRIMNNIRPYVNEPFADSLLVEVCKRYPTQLYSFAQAANSPEGKLIRRSQNPTVQSVVTLSETPNALLYFPFLDDILSGKQTIESIKKLVGDGEIGYDSVGYYQLLVKTEVEYYQRLIKKDTPIAMFGVNGLRDMLQRKAVQHFITPINELHEVNNLDVRMRAINPLTPQEIYFMMVMGENDIYTSSYKHSFARMLKKMGAKPRTDSLLMSVNMDFFKKFIKMAANFNQLDTFLRLMPKANSDVLMKAFVAKLDNASNLEDAVDVADSYGSIKDPVLLQKILQYVNENEQKAISEGNNKGKVIYWLLKTIFLSIDSTNRIDLTREIGIPSIYTVDTKYLSDDSGRIVQQVFFYGDDDGKQAFNGFINSFPAKDWRIDKKAEWVEIKSLKGKRVWIYANRPLDNDSNLDDSAQIHLNKYLLMNDIAPSIVIHRGHSYWLPRTIDRMPGDVKVVILGSCGGFKNLNQILSICPDAHIVSTKEIGKGDINRPILNYLNQVFASGKNLDWKEMWNNLNKFFAKDPNKDVRESWEDYIPPYRNLGAVFIKAYHKQMENEPY